MASYGSLKKNYSVLNSLYKEDRENQGNEFPNENRPYSIVLISQILALKEKDRRRESLLPAIGRSMTEGGGGPSVAEVATSFPARLLGAIEELQEFSKFSK